MSDFLQKFRQFFKRNLSHPTYVCMLCGAEVFGDDLCADCKKSLTLNDGETCPVCGRKTAKSEICIECKAHAPIYKKAVSPLIYEGGAVRLMAKFKNGAPYIAQFLAPLMYDKLKSLPEADGIVFVPVTKKTKRRRGYNQAQKLAMQISLMSGIPVLENAVIKTKETPEQKGLSQKERIRNLSGCFKVDKNSVKGKTIIIADDVMTTGATVDTIARLLKNAGTCSVFVVTAASVAYK